MTQNLTLMLVTGILLQLHAWVAFLTPPQNATNMTNMFNHTTVFNKKNVKRNIANVVLMRDMFDDASKFNQKLFWDMSGDPII